MSWTFAPSGVTLPENWLDIDKLYDEHYPPIKCADCGEDIEQYRTTYSQSGNGWAISIGYVRLPNAHNSADKFRCNKCYQARVQGGTG